MSFFFPIAIMGSFEMTKRCSPGEHRQFAAGLVCSPCPMGMQCVDGESPPEPCPLGTASIAAGAARCCRRDTVCPPGTAVSGADCACMDIACHAPFSVLVRAGRDLQCVDGAMVRAGASQFCAQGCGDGYVLEDGCACARVRDCSRSASASWWRTAQQRFMCVSNII